MKMMTIGVSAVMTALWALPATGQQDKSQSPPSPSIQTQGQSVTSAQKQKQENASSRKGTHWSYDQIYSSGWSGKGLMDQGTVYGPNGDDIGSIENLIIGDDGRLLGVIAEVGGFLDIGDTHVFVPWDQLEIDLENDRVTIPVTEENIENYVYKDDVLTKDDMQRRQVVSSDLATGPRVWKATELLDDRAVLSTGVAFGWVTDLIFSPEGSLQSVVVTADASFRGGYYAYPYHGHRYGWHPGANQYNVAEDVATVLKLGRFDYDKMGGDTPVHSQAQQDATDDDGVKSN